MSKKIKFLGGTTSNLRQEYLERVKYYNLVEFEGMIDVWYENHDYGMLSSDFEPVVTIEDVDTSKDFIGYADGVSALNFVAVAFSDFRDSFIRKTNNSTIQAPPYMQGLIPKSGFTSFDDLYSNWLVYCSAKYSSFLQNDLSITTYQTYLDVLKKHFINNLRNFPITKSGFCLSSKNDIKTTGLAIELTDLDPNVDTFKGEIVQSVNFKCFVEEAQRYGFYVDKNVPWRLLANLDSKMMRLYIRGLEVNPGTSTFQKHYEEQMNKDQNHKHLTTTQILDTIYRSRTHYDDLFHVQDFVIKVYNQMVLDVPYYTKMEYRSHNNSYEKINVFRSEVDFLSAEQWLELLVMIRLLELDSYTELLYDKMIEKAKNIYRSYGLRSALGFVGKEMSTIIRSQFSKPGRIDIINNEEFTTNPSPRAFTRPSNPGYTPPSGGSSSGY